MEIAEPLRVVIEELSKPQTHSHYKDDIIEMDDAFVVEVELPGFKKSDIEMSIKKDGLMVTATKSVKESDARYIHKKRPDSNFSKIYRLGKEVDIEKIEATLADGLLTITLPKGGDEQPRSIKIS